MTNTPQQQRIVVHGATGTQGRPLVARLVADRHHVVSVTRHSEGPDIGHEHVRADLGDRASLAAAYRGADAVVVQLPLVFDESAVAQAESVLGALADAKVRRAVFNANGPLAAEPIGFPYVDARAILAAGLGDAVELASVVVPAGAYMENLAAPGVGASVPAGELRYPLPAEVPMPWVALVDMADVVASLLVDAAPSPSTIVVGPEALTGDEAASRLSDALGHEVRWVQITPAEFEQMVAPQIGPAAAAGIAGFYANAGEGPPPPFAAATFVTGATTLEQWARTADWPAQR